MMIRTCIAAASALFLLSACGGDADEAQPADQPNPTDAPTDFAVERGSSDKFWGDRLSEVHLTMEDGRTILCLYNTYEARVESCDWDHPLVDPAKDL